MKNMEDNLLQGIDTVIVRVTNLENSSLWYATKLELNTVFEDPNMKLVVLNTNGPTSLTLWQTDQIHSINRHAASYPIFKTTDADALRQKLLSQNVETGEINQDDNVTFFHFYDPDGNIMEACQVHE
jgi:catechol 2,3-dioxygenase-like lactoylglutathione lyase family enzyme